MIVEENTLNQHISTLRRVLGENRGENRLIATPGRGYRFIPEVNTLFSRASENEEENAKQVRIGVLPFENIGAGEEREYFADGLTEETIAIWARSIRSILSAIGRTSVRAYKRTTKSLAEILGGS